MTDLAKLTLDTCIAHLGHTFVRPVPGAEGVALVLQEAGSTRRDPASDSRTGRPFSLLFRGPVEPRLDQGLHDLQHEALQLPGVFLVPVGADADGVLYEAVFT